MKTINEKLRTIAKSLFKERYKEENFVLSERKSIHKYEGDMHLFEYSATKTDKNQLLVGRVYLLESGKEILKDELKEKELFVDTKIDKKLITEAKKTYLASSSVKISPEKNKFSIKYKQKLCEEILTTISSKMTRKADVYFLADTTGSMASVLSAIKSSINNIITSLNSIGHDIEYGVGNYKDFPTDPYAYRHQLNITNSSSNINSAVNNWVASGGSDTPEGQFYALDQIASNPIGWRAGAKRIIVWFGDAPAQDPICSSISGLPYSITEATVISKLKSSKISVIALNNSTLGLDDDPKPLSGDYGSCTSSGNPGQASRIATQTGGSYYPNVSSTSIVSSIINSITTTLNTINSLSLVPKGGIIPFVNSITPSSFGPITLDTDHTFKFDVKFLGVEKCDTKTKVYEGFLDLVADGVVLAYKPVEISILPCSDACSCVSITLEKELLEERNKKYHEEIGLNSMTFKEHDCCQILDLPEFQPCFSIRWGDSNRDELETHDTEIVYITVKNPYGNIKYNNLIIEKIFVTPNQILPNGENSFQIIPDKIICYESIEPCSEITRQYAFHIRNAIPGLYSINIEYKICNMEFVGNHSGNERFQVELIDS